MAEQLGALDIKVLEHFLSCVVRKDLVSTLNGQVNVPIYVLEHLTLGQWRTRSLGSDQAKYRDRLDREAREASLFGFPS